MTENSFKQAHLAELNRLAASSADDPLLGPQDKARLERFKQQSPPAALIPVPPTIRAAFFLRGGAVDGINGIDSLLAGKTLTHCAQMFTEQAKIDERDAVRKQGGARRRRGSGNPAVLFTGTPRGSFGFEFAPVTSDEERLPLHSASLEKLVKAIVWAANGDEVADDSVPDQVLPHLKLFFKDLAAFNVSLRIATSSGVRQDLTAEVVTRTAERLAKKIVDEQTIRRGVFRGLTLDTGRFDFRGEDGSELSGDVRDDLTDEELLAFNRLTQTKCEASLLQRTVTHPGRPEAVTYVLLDLRSQAVDVS